MSPLDMYLAVKTDWLQVFIQKLDFFSAHNPKNNIRNVFRGFPSKCPCRDVELNFDSVKEVFLENPKLFMLKGVEKYHEEILKKIFFSNCSRGPCSFEISAKKLSPNSDIYCSESQNKKNSFHLAKKFWTKIFIWTLRMQFWHLCPHILANVKEKTFAQSLTMEKNFYFQKKSWSLKFSSGQTEWRYNNTA